MEFDVRQKVQAFDSMLKQWLNATVVEKSSDKYKVRWASYGASYDSWTKRVRLPLRERPLRINAINEDEFPKRSHPKNLQGGDIVYDIIRKRNWVVAENDPYLCEIKSDDGTTVLYEYLKEFEIKETYDDSSASENEEELNMETLKQIEPIEPHSPLAVQNEAISLRIKKTTLQSKNGIQSIATKVSPRGKTNQQAITKSNQTEAELTQISLITDMLKDLQRKFTSVENKIQLVDNKVSAIHSKVCVLESIILKKRKRSENISESSIKTRDKSDVAISIRNTPKNFNFNWSFDCSDNNNNLVSVHDIPDEITTVRPEHSVQLLSPLPADNNILQEVQMTDLSEEEPLRDCVPSEQASMPQPLLDSSAKKTGLGMRKKDPCRSFINTRLSASFTREELANHRVREQQRMTDQGIITIPPLSPGRLNNILNNAKRLYPQNYEKLNIANIINAKCRKCSYYELKKNSS